MAESAEERARRLKAARQRRWRLRREQRGAAGSARRAGLPDAAGGPGSRLPVPADVLPDHMGAPMFSMLRRLGVATALEAERYTQYVSRLAPEEALMPLRPGASPPAAEARLQRAEARAVLSAMAATPVTAARVLRDVSGSFDLAREAMEFQEGRPSRLLTSHIGGDGRVVPGEAVIGDPDEDG